MNKYNRKEMEERLPAYIFGELSDIDKQIFELSLSDYPDIQDEIKQVRRTFELLDKIDYDKVLFDKTKDIPTRVAREVAKSNFPKKQPFISFRFLVPALITAGLLFVVVKTGFINNYWNDLKPKKNNMISQNIKIDSIVNEIVSDTQVQNEIADVSNYDSLYLFFIDEDEIDQQIQSYYEQFILGLNSYFNTTNSPNIESYLTINSNIENIDEEIFEQIIEEIKNANL